MEKAPGEARGTGHRKLGGDRVSGRRRQGMAANAAERPGRRGGAGGGRERPLTGMATTGHW